MNDNDQAPAERDAMFQRLKALRQDCVRRGCNKHDQAFALIAACIDEGVVTGRAIIGVLNRLGFNPAHVAKLLHDKLGQLWHRDGDRYHTALPPLASKT